MMKGALVLFAFLLILPSASQAEGDERVIGFVVETPRRFGYVVGDEIIHEAKISVRSPFVIVAETIPREGIENEWLSIKKVETGERKIKDGRTYTIRITYQIFYEPDELTWLTIPERKVGFAGGGDAFEVVIPAWSFTIAPLLPEDATDIAKDRPPRFVPVFWSLVRFFALAFALLSIFVVLAYRKLMRVILGRRGPFARAERDLRQMFRKKKVLTKEEAKNALRRIHRAFDEHFGNSLFAYQLEEFFALYPSFAKEERVVREFFEISSRLFFGAVEDALVLTPEFILGIARTMTLMEKERRRER
jgi:mxaA protein